MQQVTYDRDKKRFVTIESSIGLTLRESQVYEILLDGKGKPVHQDDVVIQVFGLEAESNVVAAYVRYLRKKLRLIGVDEGHIQTVRGEGYAIRQEG